jgi:hypothetical protein
VLTLTRRAAVASLIAGGIATGPVAVAQASDSSLRATVKRDVPRITASQARILTGLSKFEKTHSATALIKAIRAQDRNLTSLRHRLTAESASSTAGRRGKTDIIRGLTLIVGSNKTLAKDIAKAASHQTVPKAQVAAASAADKRGNRELVAGAKLLKA